MGRLEDNGERGIAGCDRIFHREGNHLQVSDCYVLMQVDQSLKLRCELIGPRVGLYSLTCLRTYVHTCRMSSHVTWPCAATSHYDPHDPLN